jgi:hypothetical protein
LKAEHYVLILHGDANEVSKARSVLGTSLTVSQMTSPASQTPFNVDGTLAGSA